MAGAGSPGSARSSWVRELMPSLANTFFKWYWTVRPLMNSRAPISGFDRPSRASLAICVSWAVNCVLVSAERLRGFACGPQLTPGPLGKRLDAHRVEHVVGSAQLHARVAATALAA